MKLLIFLLLTAGLFLKADFEGRTVTAAPSESDGQVELRYYNNGEAVRLEESTRDSLLDNITFDQSDSAGVSESIRQNGYRYYSRYGYFNASIDSVLIHYESKIGIDVFSRPDCRFEVEDIDYYFTDNESSLLDDFIWFFGAGDYYAQEELEAEILRVVAHLEDLGYPLAELSVTRFQPNRADCTLELELEIDTGEELYAAGVWTDGLSQHDPDYIETASGIRADDKITPDLFRKGRRNLENTGLFHDVSDGEIMFRDGLPFVHYEVTERRANHFDLLFGYDPGQADAYNVIGRGEVMVRNVGWQGSSLRIMFERLEDMVTRLETGYKKQWIMGMPLGAEASFRFVQQDTSYQIRTVNVGGSYEWAAGRELSVSLSQSATSANTNPDLPLLALDGVTRSAGIGFRYDNTDSRFAPTRGMIFNINVGSGIRRVTDERAEELESRGTMMQQMVNSSLEVFYSPFQRQVAAFRVHGATLESPEYSESELMPLGGSGSIRGYREEQFRVARSVWSDLEYRYLLDPYSHAFLFLAGGAYQRPDIIGQQGSGTSDWLHSGGFGFRYRTPIGMMQFTYAVSGDDPIYNGKIHFSLNTEF